MSRLSALGGLAAVGVAACATVVAALALPVEVAEFPVVSEPAFLTDNLDSSATRPEDLGAFLESRRWGVFEPEVPVGAEPAPPPPPALVEPRPVPHRLIGVIAKGEERAVLLSTPDGDVVRRSLGAVLEDGRVLVLISREHLVLRRPGTHVEEVLPLFPSVRPAVAPAPREHPAPPQASR